MNQTLATQTPAAVALEETLLWLCSIPSPIGEEKELCDAVVERLSRRTLPAPIRRYGDSIVVPVARKKKPGTKHIALVGHLDTVRTENGPARIEKGRCYGAGASDMKSGLAVMIVLAETIGELLPCDLTLVFYAREEGAYAENELGPVLEQDPELSKVDLAVCLEPSDNRLHLGCCGSIHASVTFQGKTGHSARPWEAENAITKAAGLLDRLAVLAPIEHRIEDLVYRTVTTATMAAGGRGRNVVPDRFTINLNHRFAPSTSIEQAKADILEIVRDEAEVEFTDVSPAAMPSKDNQLVKQLIETGIKVIEPKQAWTDVARFATLGIPAINFGPGENAQAHQKNESTDLRLVFTGYTLLFRWFATLK